VLNQYQKKTLEYRIADAAIDYFGDGRFQIMQYDVKKDYYLKDMKSSFEIFIGKIKAYRKVGNKVYFIHDVGYTILDYKNISMKQYIDKMKYSKSNIEYFEDTLTRVNKRSFGDRWILLNKYDDLTPKEKEIFYQLKQKSK